MCMLDLDPFIPLEEVTHGLSKSLPKASTNAFPHTTDDAPRLGSVIQNIWYHEECPDTGDAFNTK